MPVPAVFPDVFVQDRPIHEILFESCKKYSSSVAFIDATTNKRYSYRDVYLLSKSVAVGWHKAGLKHGDTVVTCMSNCPDFAFVLLGTLDRGGIVSGVNPVYTEDELRRHFIDSDAKFVVTSPDCLEKVQKAAQNSPTVKKILLKSGTAEHTRKYNNVNLLESFYQYSLEDYKSLPKVKIYTKTDVAMLPYSSGTTGVPKGVMLSHYNLATCLAVLNSPFFLSPQHGDYGIAFLPSFHIFGFMLIVVGLQKGTTLITVPKYEPGQFLGLIQDYKVKMIYIVPPVLVFLAKHPMVSDFDLSTLESVFVAAAPVGKDISEELYARHPNVKYLIQGYGMTEQGGASHLNPPAPKSEVIMGSCGLLAPNWECKVVNTETGAELGPNENGEILVRGTGVMLGYWKRPKATAETIDKDGWLHTGDIGYYDDDGFFFIVDRLKELIKVKGFQVAPAELEDLLLSNPGIQDCAVIGLPDNISGEVPKAFVVLKPNSHLTEAQINDFLNEKIAPYKRLKGGIEFMAEIPKSPSGKILRRVLKESHKENQARSKL